MRRNHDPLDAIETYLAGQPEPKQRDLRTLHEAFRALVPPEGLSFLDGRDETGKVVTNPNIGYGRLSLRYADGSSRPFYQIGLTANSAGVSVFVMGLNDRDYLKTTYGAALGKATVTS